MWPCGRSARCIEVYEGMLSDGEWSQSNCRGANAKTIVWGGYATQIGVEEGWSRKDLRFIDLFDVSVRFRTDCVALRATAMSSEPWVLGRGGEDTEVRTVISYSGQLHTGSKNVASLNLTTHITRLE